jgi:hypothetical protein
MYTLWVCVANKVDLTEITLRCLELNDVDGIGSGWMLLYRKFLLCNYTSASSESHLPDATERYTTALIKMAASNYLESMQLAYPYTNTPYHATWPPDILTPYKMHSVSGGSCVDTLLWASTARDTR